MQEVIETMDDCIMTSCSFYLFFYSLLDFALPVSADLYLQIVRPATICYLHVGNTFCGSGLSPLLQTAVVLALGVLTLKECFVNFRPCFYTPGKPVGRIVPESLLKPASYTGVLELPSLYL